MIKAKFFILTNVSKLIVWFTIHEKGRGRDNEV